MAENINYFTFIWKIKNLNINIVTGKDINIVSPSFFVKAMAETWWKLCIKYSFDHIYCFLHRLPIEAGPHQFELNYELSYLAGDGSVLYPHKYLKNVFVRGGLGNFALFLHERNLYTRDDTLTIRCRMWDFRESSSQLGQCFAESRLETKMKSLVGTFSKLSCAETGLKYPIRIKSSSANFSVFSINLSVAASGLLNFEIKSIDKHIFKMGKIFILDVLENKVTSAKSELYFDDSFSILLTPSRDLLIRNKHIFLPNDELTICCEIIEGTGKISDHIEYIFDSEDAPGVMTNSRRMDQSCEESQAGNIPTLKGDMISLFGDSTFSDSKLKTATETFPVHAAILSARSPVFKSMFATDMKEKTNNCVEIDDLDADTVRRMLLYIYSDTLDDLDCESAKSLYFAADKYNIDLLKQRCSDFLKQKLLDSNCCDVLLLADKHQDADLKNAVQDFIAKNSESVLFSDEWKNMEKKHSHLTTEVFRFIYMIMRRN